MSLFVYPGKERSKKKTNTRGKSAINSSRKQGKAHEADCSRGMKLFMDKHDRFYYKRIQDVSDYLKQRCPRCGCEIFKQLQFSTNPGDYMAAYKGNHYFLECKSSRSKTSWSMRYIREKQLNELMSWLMADDRAYVIVANRNKVRNYKCWAVRANIIYGEYIQALQGHRKWSIKWTEFENTGYPMYAVELERGDRCWLFDNLFGD